MKFEELVETTKLTSIPKDEKIVYNEKWFLEWIEAKDNYFLSIFCMNKKEVKRFFNLFIVTDDVLSLGYKNFCFQKKK